jgi:hypothetical protein
MAATDAFSIIILGGMNPRIHHPLFYQTIGVLTDAEVGEAVLRENTLSMAHLAQLDIGDVRLVCLPDRWQVETSKYELCPRLLEIASRAMTALEYTPVGAVGFNFDFVRPSGRAQTELLFATMGRSLRLGFEDAAQASASFTYSVRSVGPEGRRRHSVTVRPLSELPEHVLVRNNFNYDITLTGKFDLASEVLEPRYAPDRALAFEQAARTMRLIGGIT